MEIEKNTPLQNEDGEQDILYEEMEAAVKWVQRHKTQEQMV